MDLEVDDLFAERREQPPGVELLARISRVPGGSSRGEKLFDEVRNSRPVRETLAIEAGSLGAHVSEQAGDAVEPIRKSEVRFLEATRLSKVLARMTIMHVREEGPLVERPEWFLLTTLPVEGAVDAERILKWHGLRQRIEEYFQIMKSGCRIEDLRNQTAERLQRAIALNMVIAWRIHLMARFGRNAPGLPAGIPNSGYRSRSPHHDISGCRRTLGTRLAVREADSRFIGMPSRIFDD